MKDRKIINSIKKLVACGIAPHDACVACMDFVSRFGKRDLDAFVRCVEVRHVDTI